MNFLSIDPSVNNIGFAILQIKNGKPSVLKDGTLYPDKELSIQQKAEWVFASLQKIDAQFDESIIQCVFEYPTFMGGIKGLIASQKGYTIDLGVMVGYLSGLLLGGFPNDVFYYTPMQWKGTRPKTATQAEIKRKFPSFRPHSEHSIDAIGMALHHFKVMKYCK